MQLLDYKKYYFFIGLFLLLIGNSLAQPSKEAPLFIMLDTEKYDIAAYTLFEEDSVSNGTFLELEITIHTQNRDIAIMKSIDDLITNNVLIVITDKKFKNEKMKIFMTGCLKSFNHYVLDIAFTPNNFSLHIENSEALKVHKSYMGSDLTPELKKIID